MCGIAGIIRPKGDPYTEIKAMTDALTHRGPNSEGFAYCSEDAVVLGHRRLSILDLSPTGKQPMVSGDGRYTLVFNGEIYNYDDLKKQLQRQYNVQFIGTSDTEVLLNCFIYYGVQQTLKRINGMFAIGLYDKQNKQLVLARDRGGEKPLYYGWLGDSFVFASELKSIRAVDKENTLQVNENSVKLFLKYSYVPQPLSIYKNIYKLKQGHYVIINAPFTEVTEYQEYWRLDEIDESYLNLSYEDAKNTLRYLITESVKKQMVSDVPYGAFLSGGIDSSLITAVMQTQSAQPIKTFSIGFDDNSFNEAGYAKKIAQYLGTEHYEQYFQYKELVEFAPLVSKVYDEPVADISQLAMCILARTAKEKVTVCLSGDCGDELFLGYTFYTDVLQKRKQFSPMLSYLMGTGLQLLKPLDMRFYSLGAQYKNLYGEAFWENYHASDYFAGMFDLTCEEPDIFFTKEEIRTLRDFPTQLGGWAFYSTMSDMIIAKVDRATMFSSLESRIPLLDKEIIKFAASIPAEYKIREGRKKAILQDLLSEYIPVELFNRPKQGFTVPMHSFLRNELRQEMNHYIYDGILSRNFPFIDNKKLEREWEKFQKGNDRAGMYDFWKIYVLGQWLETYMN